MSDERPPEGRLLFRFKPPELSDHEIAVSDICEEYAVTGHGDGMKNPKRVEGGERGWQKRKEAEAKKAYVRESYRLVIADLEAEQRYLGRRREAIAIERERLDESIQEISVLERGLTI